MLVVFVVIGFRMGILVDKWACVHTGQSALRRTATPAAHEVRQPRSSRPSADEVAV